MKALAIAVLLATTAPALATNATVERKQTTTVERDNDDHGDWGLLGLLGLAGLAGLLRRDKRPLPTASVNPYDTNKRS